MNDLFKQGVVFELEKDSSFYNSQEFRHRIENKYGFKPKTQLYLDIVNYQIYTYGTTLNPRDSRNNLGISQKSRRNRTENYQRRYDTQKFIERVERNERQNMVHTRKAS